MADHLRRRRVLRRDEEIHNGLQGAKRALSDDEKARYLANARENAAAFTEQYDFVFMHDPQTAAILPMRGKGSARWVWRCHIDTSSPHPEVWDFIRPMLVEYDAAIFTMRAFVPPSFPHSRVEIIPPAIDPLSPKNMPLAPDLARRVLEWIGIRSDRPLVTQVSRFDPWKDPMGVIAAYCLARKEIAGLELALVGSMALDDPEGWKIHASLVEESRRDPGIHVLTNLVGVGNIEVNAFQTLSNVVVQKSIREGFGLVVSEALWKGTPVVAGRAGGIPLQMADGVGGALVGTVEECAAAMVALLRDPAHAKATGAAGRERVREHFLVPRLVLDELGLMRQLSASKPLAIAPVDHRDPVCGMGIDTTPFSATWNGTTYRFCSERCRSVFVSAPTRFLRPAAA